MKPFRWKAIVTTHDPCACLPVSLLLFHPSVSLLCRSSVVTISDPWPMSRSLVIFVAVLNVAPRAPYQHYNKNSWEQLKTWALTGV